MVTVPALRTIGERNFAGAGWRKFRLLNFYSPPTSWTDQAKCRFGYDAVVAFSTKAGANNRWDIRDDVRRELVGLAFGRRNAQAIVEALNARFGAGEQLELELEGTAAA